MGLQYQPLTESLRELNRMLIEKQSFDADMKMRQAELGLQSLMRESQLKSAYQQQQLAQYQLLEQERMHTPKVINLGLINQGGPEQLAQIESNPEAMTELGRVLDDEGVGYKYSAADKTWRHPETNEPIRFSPYEMRFRLPGMYGIIDKYTDAVAGWQKNLSVINSSLKTVDAELAKAKKNKYTASQIEEIMTVKQNILDQKKQHEALLTEDGLMTYYNGKAEKQRKRASYYRNIGALDMAASLDKSAEQADASVRTIMDNMLRQKTTKDTQPTGDITVYSTAEQIYKGKTYKVGDSRKVRYAPGQTELIVEQGWDLSDPLAEEKRKGSAAEKKPIFSTLAMTKQFAEDVKTEGFMGDVTSAQAVKVRDAMSAAARNIAKQNNLGPNDDRYQVYGQVKEWFALARDKYWADMEDIQTNFDIYRDKLKSMPQYKDLSKDELRRVLEDDIKATFDDDISQLTGGKHERFYPSKITKRAARSVE